MLTKAINYAVLGIAFSPAIRLAMAGNFTQIIDDYSLGFSKGDMNPANIKARAVRTYGPIVGAILLKKAISMVRKTARV